MIRPFTGWHMLAVMVAFFGVVIAVNVVMASDAIRTFGGTVVDNSYVATLRYNNWLAEARSQRARQWRAVPSVDGGGVVRVALSRAGQPVDGAAVSITANHPLGRVAERTLILAPASEGTYRATTAMPHGRWLIHIDVRVGDEDARFDDEVRT